MRGRMSSVVLWQSIWYLLSFYLTWPPYLALQYLWAAGSGYNSYGFTLFACTLVPLQGFWNCVVFFRLRVKKAAAQAASKVSSNISRARASRYSSQEGVNASAAPDPSTLSQAQSAVPSQAESSVAEAKYDTIEDGADKDAEAIASPGSPPKVQRHGSVKRNGSLVLALPLDAIDENPMDEVESEPVVLDNGWVGSLTLTRA